jgi:putative hydrolase of the HAD superfamily
VPTTPCKAVFFDAEGTLFHVRSSVGEIYAKVAESHCVKADPRVLNARFEDALANGLPFSSSGNSLEARQKAERDWWTEIVASVFHDLGPFRNFSAFFDDVFEAFRGSEGWHLYPDTLEVLKFLRIQGLSMSIISNFDFRLEGVTLALGIRCFFDGLMTPGQAGAVKPDPKIFQSALNALGVTASQAVHVGDSMKSDVEGAKAAGITPILIDRANRYPHVSGLLKIPSLYDLKSLIVSI